MRRDLHIREALEKRHGKNAYTCWRVRLWLLVSLPCCDAHTIHAHMYMKRDVCTMKTEERACNTNEQSDAGHVYKETCVAACCSILQCIAMCCSVWQCVAVCCSVLQVMYVSRLQSIPVYVLQCVAVCCSTLQCVC